MRRIALVAPFAVLALAACSGDDSSSTAPAPPPTTAASTTDGAPTSTAAPDASAPSAEVVLGTLRAAGLPIGEHVNFTAETDPNSLLGRPGQYSSKVNFHDTRLDRSDTFDTEGGGSIEVFESAGAAADRVAYIDSVTKGNAMLAEYHWSHGQVVLRVSKQLTPDQADAYRAALEAG